MSSDVVAADYPVRIERDERGGLLRPLIVPALGKYRLGVERTGWWQRIVQILRWQPSSYRQVWLGAPLGWGVPGFIIWSVIGHHSPYEALTYAMVITFSGGLGQSWQLNRRRERGL